MLPIEYVVLTMTTDAKENVNEKQQSLAGFFAQGETIFSAMHKEILKAGIETDILPQRPFEKGLFKHKVDPYTRCYTLEGEWRDENGQKKGEIVFHGDGSFYAEYDVVQTHPSKPTWFIECVTAWGREDMLKTEMKMLPMVS